jgi:Cu-Zn family superoxide dismutase
LASGCQQPPGTVTITADAAIGARYNLHLHGLPPGPHDFHVHEDANCGSTMMFGIRIPAGAAGEIFDPATTTAAHQPATVAAAAGSHAAWCRN